MCLTLSLAFLCKAKAAEQTSKPSTFSKQRNDLQYGITGCGEFSRGIRNQKLFCLKLDSIHGNCDIFRNYEVVAKKNQTYLFYFSIVKSSLYSISE